MARIAGVDLPKNERVEIGLTRIFGVGRSLSKKILSETKVNPDTRVRDLTDEDIVKIRSVIDRDFRIEGDLRRDISMNIKRLMDIGCYRGLRHRSGLPVRGQRTRTNARTRKGPRKAAVGKKREA
ncbi:MAG: 30S ribosomal protein S13 [Nitrospirota bacterium]